jgi:arabinose-5-phosphate isomerase
MRDSVKDYKQSTLADHKEPPYALSDHKISELGRSVLETEAQAILGLLPSINEDFISACRHLFNRNGRIIVTGIGKSGHIARKLAATFASTGNPSFFVHPAEAKHGDMGMITANDVVIALSHSGETEELLFLLPTIKRLGAVLITLTGNASSSLAKAATVNLNVAVAQEACPLGLAPTSSTTATLAMGDALAISLLQMCGFTSTDFAFSHPGGMLGRRLLLIVDQVMRKEDAIPKVQPDVLLKTALLEMSKKKLGMTTITNESNQLLGIYTDGDLRRTFDKDIDVRNTLIHEVMSKNPKVIRLGTLAAEALHIMQQNKITTLVVLNEQDTIEGVIHMHDILQTGIT